MNPKTEDLIRGMVKDAIARKRMAVMQVDGGNIVVADQELMATIMKLLFDEYMPTFMDGVAARLAGKTDSGDHN